MASMLEAYTSPSIVADSSRAVIPLLPVRSPLMPRSPRPPSPGTARSPLSARPAITRLCHGPFSIRPGRAEKILLRQACPPAVSAPDGHGMILMGRCVDIEDTTYRVT